MSYEVFGGGEEEDLFDIAEQYGYSLRADGNWWNEADDTDGDTVKTDEEMWQYISDRRDDDDENFALAGGMDEPTT